VDHSGLLCFLLFPGLPGTLFVAYVWYTMASLKREATVPRELFFCALISVMPAGWFALLTPFVFLHKGARELHYQLSEVMVVPPWLALCVSTAIATGVVTFVWRAHTAKERTTTNPLGLPDATPDPDYEG
jgi:hypothetical protein